MFTTLQVANWEVWGQNAQAQFQQQLQQQLAALNHQLSEKHRAELDMALQATAAGKGNTNVRGYDIACVCWLVCLLVGIGSPIHVQ